MVTSTDQSLKIRVLYGNYSDHSVECPPLTDSNIDCGDPAPAQLTAINSTPHPAACAHQPRTQAGTGSSAGLSQ